MVAQAMPTSWSGGARGQGSAPATEKGRQMNQFLIGEPVQRKMDGAVGKVVKIHEYANGEVHYVVDLGRPPLEGQVDDCWLGTEQAWRRVRILHAHVETDSRDCDGRYTKGYTDVLTTVERVSEFGELEFKERVMNSIVSLHAEHATLEVMQEGLLWRQPTDEGYSHADVTWCSQEDCDSTSWQRDHSAEKAGY